LGVKGRTAVRAATILHVFSTVSVKRRKWRSSPKFDALLKEASNEKERTQHDATDQLRGGDRTHG
jgi:hypothetical protein